MTESIEMGKVNEWLEQVRNTFINASELAQKVAGLQAQVNEMTLGLEGLRSLNRTLDENLSWSRSERDRLDNALIQSQSNEQELRTQYAAMQKDRDGYRVLADERASIIATLQSDNETISIKNMMLEDENKLYAKRLDAIENALHLTRAADTGQAQAVEVTKTEPIKPEPFVHPVTGVVQGRDPETKQFVPLKEGHPEQKDDPGLPDEPWWMSDKAGSGF